MTGYGQEDSIWQEGLKEQLNGLIAGWDTEELIELMGECEFVLSGNDARIRKLDVRGLKRLWLIITGIQRKNTTAILKNMHEIQKLSFEIQKLIIKRISGIQDVMITLNHKFNEQTIWTQDIILSLCGKIKYCQDSQQELKAVTDLLMWKESVCSKKTYNGRKYMEVSDGIKILQIVSDLYEIVGRAGVSVEHAFMESVTHRLNLKSPIQAIDFYNDLIYEKESLSLYIREDFLHEPDSLCPCGRMIHKIYQLYEDPLLAEVALGLHMPSETICKQMIQKQIRPGEEQILPVQVCMELLDDLLRLQTHARVEQQEWDWPESGTPTEIPFMENRSGFCGTDGEAEYGPGPDAGRVRERPYAGDRIHGNENDGSGEKRLRALVRVTPEELWGFKEGDLFCQKNENVKSRYVFLDENVVKSFLERYRPCLVTGPVEFWRRYMPDTGNGLWTDQMVFIPLAYYYMYLWFYNTSKSKRINQKVVMLEYYDHVLYAAGYSVDASGDSFREEFTELEIRWNKTRKHIMESIMEQTCFAGLSREDVLIFKTFTADAHIDKKLEKKQVQTVDAGWEYLLKMDQKTLEIMIQELWERYRIQRNPGS